MTAFLRSAARVLLGIALMLSVVMCSPATEVHGWRGALVCFGVGWMSLFLLSYVPAKRAR